MLDLTRVIAGPLCTQLLTDMGAVVYTIEKRGEGDDTRRMGPFLPDTEVNCDSNDSALYLAYNRGKRSITLDIAKPEGRALRRPGRELQGRHVGQVRTRLRIHPADQADIVYSIASPSEVFDCAEGQLIVAAGNNRQFQALCRVLEQPDLVDDARFATNALRVANRAALREILAGVLKSRKRGDLLRRFEEAGVPGGPINDMSQVFADPQTLHREVVVNLPHGRSGEVPSLRSPLRFSTTPVVHRPPPMLGQHTAEVLEAELGIRAQGLEDLRSQRVV